MLETPGTQKTYDHPTVDTPLVEVFYIKGEGIRDMDRQKGYFTTVDDQLQENKVSC